MKRWKVRPFTLFLLLTVLAFLILAPGLILSRLLNYEPVEFLLPEKPEWTGIITIWDIPYVEAGTGNHLQWMSRSIRTFEKEYPGVYIQVRPMTPERLRMYMAGEENAEFLPDIISLGLYDEQNIDSKLMDISSYFQPHELERFLPSALDHVITNTGMYGIPWMMGAYGLVINKSLLQSVDLHIENDLLDYPELDRLVRALSFEKTSGRKKIINHGFTSYTSTNSKPLLSMIYHNGGKITDSQGFSLIHQWNQEKNILPDTFAQASYASSYRMFAVEKRVGIMLGSSRLICDLKKLQSSGKGFEFQIYNIPYGNDNAVFQDQVAAYGIINGKDFKRNKMALLFLKSLLEDKNQSRLKELGMFPVIKMESIYDESDPLYKLEQTLHRYRFNPLNLNEINRLWQAVVESLSKESS